MNSLSIVSLLAFVGVMMLMPSAFAFDPTLIDISVQDSSVLEYPDYNIITIIFSIFNGDSETANFSGTNMLYLNDTNSDWWEYSNHNDHEGLSATDCPQLDVSIQSGISTDVKLCYLVQNDPTIGYSVIANNNQHLMDMEIKEFTLESVPSWFKTTANGWCSDTITESEYLNSLEFNIQEGNIDVLRGQSETDLGIPLPQWIKSNACDWSNDSISDYEFLDGVYWLIDNGKLQLN